MARTTTARLILASSSPRRQELIRSLRLPVLVHASDVDETVPQEWEPAVIVEKLAERKAEAVYLQLGREDKEGIVIGSDTIVVLDDEVLGKPADQAEAVSMLTRLQGREHMVYSGVACIDLDGGARQIRHSRTKVRMKPMSREEINRYVETGEPMDKAGSYAIQGLGATLVTSIEGDYFTVVGLPLAMLAGMLREWGVHVI